MPVMEIRVMRMAMAHPRVRMLVRVRRMAVRRPVVRMLMVLVVHMLVRVRHGLVDMLVLMPFADMQPHAERHQRRGAPEGRLRTLAEQKKCERRAEEGRDGEISAGARRAELAQSDDEKNEADAVAE